MPFTWRAVPEALRTPLLQGGVGRMQLHSLANAALDLLTRGEDNQDFPLADFVRDVLLAAWEEAPLDLHCIRALTDLQEGWSCLPEPFMSLLAACQNGQSAPQDLSNLREMAAAHDDAGLLALVGERCAEEPANPYWLQQAVRIGGARDLPWLEDRLANARGVPEPALAALRADVALLAGEADFAVSRYEAALAALPGATVWRIRLGESLLRSGQPDEALAAWRTALNERPWQADLALRYDDLARSRHLPGDLPDGRGVILFYTWNKAELLDATLSSLEASETGMADIIVLDNGSDDATPETLALWKQRCGSRFTSLRLPCNIGAPAARNWLLSLSQVREYDWIVFLDDDIALPPDWLRYFGSAMREYPESGVFGCRVVDHDRPHIIQGADFHLGPGDSPDKPLTGRQDFVQRFSIATLHIHAAQDFGQFSYLRPCASVTGCCHLFRAGPLFRTGLFDISCSPSQFDDFEHDLRHIMAGDMPVYQGHLRVPHLRRTGSYGAGEEARLAGSWANMYKVHMSRPREEFDRLRALAGGALLDDMLKRRGHQA